MSKVCIMIFSEPQRMCEQLLLFAVVFLFFGVPCFFHFLGAFCFVFFFVFRVCLVCVFCFIALFLFLFVLLLSLHHLLVPAGYIVQGISFVPELLLESIALCLTASMISMISMTTLHMCKLLFECVSFGPSTCGGWSEPVKICDSKKNNTTLYHKEDLGWYKLVYESIQRLVSTNIFFGNRDLV